MSDQTLIEYLRDERSLPTTADRSLDDVALAAASSAYTLTQAMLGLYDKRRACLETITAILCPFSVGSIIERSGPPPRRYVVTLRLPCSPDWSAPYRLRVRALKSDGTLGDRENFLDVSLAPVTLVGQFDGEIPESDWIEDRRI